MRPEILYGLFAPITSLPGIGPRLAKLFETLAGPHLVDLCWHWPTGLIDRRYAPKLAEAQPGRIATLTLRVERHQEPRGPRQPHRVICNDGTGRIELVFFHARADYLNRTLPVGEERIVSGKVEVFHDTLQMAHPDHVGRPDDRAAMMTVEPVYPLTAGLTLKVVGKAVRAALNQIPELPEWHDPSLIQRYQWASWAKSLCRVHEPGSEADLLPQNPARMRLAYDELLANQLALGLVRDHQTRRKGRSLKGDGRLRKTVVEALPYRLTASQSRAVEEILSEMASEARMLRLLQGDVGSGKTVVALLAMVAAVEAGTQAVLMAPTEILAVQHLETLRSLAEAAGLRIELLTGRIKGKARTQALERLSSGESQIAVGTHALFQEDVAFRDLGLAVIDEQHRFGVHQRMVLGAKGQSVDILVMTATPIPRSLMLTAYGDLEASKLTERPAGRKPVDTRVLPLERLGEVTEAVGRVLQGGAKAYWVCPLVEESETSDLAAAEDRYRALAERFGGRVGLVHGRKASKEKDAAMAAFSEGPVDLLVATTVIEVGVDVPTATVLVVEHAERFGLAQLHQLRGRIGRGAAQSTCILCYQGPLGETARARLDIMRQTDDGFRIAEEDLRLRGAGELLGTRQSGFPVFRVADIAVHGELLAMARDDARLILQRDAGLTGPRGDALRVLLYLFERDQAIKYLRSG